MNWMLHTHILYVYMNHKFQWERERDQFSRMNENSMQWMASLNLKKNSYQMGWHTHTHTHLLHAISHYNFGTFCMESFVLHHLCVYVCVIMLYIINNSHIYPFIARKQFWQKKKKNFFFFLLQHYTTQHGIISGKFSIVIIIIIELNLNVKSSCIYEHCN